MVPPVSAYGQKPTVDASVGRSGSSWRLSGSALWQVTLAKRVRLGAGPRLSWFGGDSKTYRSHDERPAALGSRIGIGPDLIALNLLVSGELNLVGRLSAGANLDLAGVAIGPNRSVGGIRLAPAHGSLFQYGENDRGSLNSEYYLAVGPASRFTIRAGASHYVTGYRVTSGTIRPRYLRFDTVPFVAIRWAP